jgi:ribosomal protein S18 acetylase RimI-like enzyme
MRKAEIHDAESIVELMNMAYRGDSAKKGWTHEADLLGGIRTDVDQIFNTITTNKKGQYHLYEENGQLQGLVFLEIQDDKLYLGSLTVNPDLQSKGIGKKLLKYAETYAEANEIGIITMTVITRREELINWYERNGYVNTGIKKPFPMDDPKFGEPKTFLEFYVLEKNLK